MRGDRGAALLARGELLGRFEIVRTATAGAGIALPTLRYSHGIVTSQIPLHNVKLQILNYPVETVNRGEAAKTTHNKTSQTTRKYRTHPLVPKQDAMPMLFVGMFYLVRPLAFQSPLYSQLSGRQ